MRRSLPPEFCWSRHQFLSSCENWVSVGHSHCIHAPQSEGENRSQNTVINGDTCIIYWMIINLQAKPLQLFQERLLILSVNLVPNAIVHVLLIISWLNEILILSVNLLDIWFILISLNWKRHWEKYVKNVDIILISFN